MTLKVGDTVHIPDRIVNAWGTVIEIDGPLARVDVKHSTVTRRRITWYQLKDLHSPSEWRRSRGARRGRFTS